MLLTILEAIYYVTVCGRSLSKAGCVGIVLPSSPIMHDASSNQLGGAICPQKVARRGSFMDSESARNRDHL